MTVRLKTSRVVTFGAGRCIVQNIGDVIEVPNADGERLIRSGQVEPCELVETAAIDSRSFETRDGRKAKMR